MNLNKTILSFFLLLTISVFSQKEIEIEKLLNKELKKELQFQNDNPTFEGDSLIIVEPFKVENNILSITIKKISYYEENSYLEKQEVALDQITSIVKDINVIFETKLNAVKITQTYKNGKITKREDNLFFLQLSAEKNNEALAKRIIKVFNKAGFTIEKEYWFD